VPPTELELIAARDHDTMAHFYDRHVAMVGEFCAAVCPDERVDEAVEAVFVNFLARATEAPHSAEPEELLRKAAREIAASRMEATDDPVDDQHDPVCRAMPPLLAARVNGELPGQEGPIIDHLSDCSTCQAIAARLGRAEVMYPVGSPGGVTELRATWLTLAADTTEATAVRPAETNHSLQTPASPEPPASPLTHAADSGSGQPPEPVSVRARRGGLVGAVRRFAASRGDGESGDSRRGG
jgi:hypothetical protein